MEENQDLERNPLIAKESRDKGFSMFFMDAKQANEESNPEEYFYYFSKLPEKYSEYLNAALDILRFRNKLLILLSFEIISALFGASLFAFKRNPVLIVINALIFLLCILGLVSLVYMNEMGIVAYTLMTVSLPVAFYLYQIFEMYMVRNSGRIDPGVNNVISEQIFLALLSVPYLYDLICGCLNLYFISLIGKFNKLLKEMEKEKEKQDGMIDEEEVRNIKMKYSQNALEEEFRKRETMKKAGSSDNINLLCIICCTNTRSVICNPCHDLLMCRECSERLQTKSYLKMTCPKCRRPIISFERIYT